MRAKNRISTALMCCIILAMLIGIGCDNPPKIQGNITIQVANQLGEGVGEVAWAAGLAWINAQLADRGIQVVLVPAVQGRAENIQAIVTKVATIQARSDQLVLVVKDGEDWQQQVLDQVLATVGR